MDIRIKFDWHGMARKDRDGKIILYTPKKGKNYRVGQLSFIIQGTQISVDVIEVTGKYRNKGFGRLMMMILMALAEQVKKPIFLYATEQSEGFYKSLGMRKLYYHEIWEDVKVDFMNLNPDKKFCEQCSDLDYVWIPSGVRHIRIYL
jgi:GNAT superfamily N-acetyltransferase